MKCIILGDCLNSIKSSYIDKVLKRFGVNEFKERFLSMSHDIVLSKHIYPKIQAEREDELDPVYFNNKIYHICHDACGT